MRNENISSIISEASGMTSRQKGRAKRGHKKHIINTTKKRDAGGGVRDAGNELKTHNN